MAVGIAEIQTATTAHPFRAAEDRHALRGQVTVPVIQRVVTNFERHLDLILGVVMRNFVAATYRSDNSKEC